MQLALEIAKLETLPLSIDKNNVKTVIARI